MTSNYNLMSMTVAVWYMDQDCQQLHQTCSLNASSSLKRATPQRSKTQEAMYNIDILWTRTVLLNESGQYWALHARNDTLQRVQMIELGVKTRFLMSFMA